ncbi:MAG: glycoside hydrolase family 16 protein, partial [Bacteroidaceae bacterium]|nr:glycoside hydrolase family 16 protein [Bacteroidaceae bacterium]
MKKTLFSALMLVCMVLGVDAQVPQTLDDGYKLVWHDEFDTPGRPNPANWTYEHGFVRNREWQWYQGENATVTEDGILLITARREDRPCPWYREGSKDWKHSRQRIECTSASVISRGLHEFLYGRFIVCARIPASRGSWPAIWMLGSKHKYGWPSCGEVDIMEFYPKRGVPSILANACWGNDNGGSVWDESVKPFTHFTGKDPLWATQFHTWRMDWDKDYIRI